MKKFILLSGSANRPLALKVAKELSIKLGRVEIESFPNNEIRIRIQENVKDKTVFIIQPTIFPAERYILELALLADGAKRSGAKKIVAIIPWFGYSPQDKVFREGEPLSGEVVIRMLEATAIDEFAVADIHSDLVLKMFKKKVHSLSAMSVFIDYFRKELDKSWVSVALDKGALERAEKFSKALKLPLVKFDKTRDRKTGEVTFHKLEGSVEGKNVISFDDFVSTGGTRIKGCDFLKKEGVKKYYDCVTHLIVPETTRKLEKSNIDKIFITDSIHLESKWKFGRLKVLSIDRLIANFVKKNIL
ncbi:ribose-phosphate diphosphokinase [Patescibacteria group bacterium]